MQIELEDGIVLVVQDEKIKDMLLEKIGLKKQEKMLTWADKLSSDKKWKKRIIQIPLFRKRAAKEIKGILTKQYPDDLNRISTLGIPGHFVEKPITSQFVYHVIKKIK